MTPPDLVRGAASPDLSANGRRLTFSSNAPGIVGGDTNAADDVFVHNAKTDTTRIVSRTSAGDTGNGRSVQTAISGDGRFAAYQFSASDLVPDDQTGAADVFVYNLTTWQTRLRRR